MKLQIGSVYKNNNGEKVEIVGSFVFNGETLFLGVTTAKYNQYGQTFVPSGEWYAEDEIHEDSCFNIVGEWND